MSASDFERREDERRRAKVARYDALAPGRVAWVKQNRAYAEELRRLVCSLVMPGCRVLEVGCGLGDLVAGVSAATAIGLDISPRMIDIARERHPGLDLRVADVERDPLPEGPFDAIVLSDVIGHLDDIQRAL